MSGVIGAVAIAGEVLRWIEHLVAAGTDAVEAWGAVQKVVSEGRAPTKEEWALASDAMDAAHTSLQGAVIPDPPPLPDPPPIPDPPPLPDPPPIPDPTPTPDPPPPPDETPPSPDDMPRPPTEAPPPEPAPQPAPLGAHVLGKTPLGGTRSPNLSKDDEPVVILQSRGGVMPGGPFGPQGQS